MDRNRNLKCLETRHGKPTANHKRTSLETRKETTRKSSSRDQTNKKGKKKGDKARHQQTQEVSPEAEQKMTDLYEQVYKLLMSITHKFQRRYGGNFDDLVSEANYQFVISHKTYDGRAKFTTWLYHKVWYGLLQAKTAMKEYRKKSKLTQTIPYKGPGFVEGLFTNLSTDGRDMVSVAVGMADFKGRKKLGKQMALMDKMVEDHNWSYQRIVDSFLEVREAIT